MIYCNHKWKEIQCWLLLLRATVSFAPIWVIFQNSVTYLVNLRHCTHLIGVQKSVKSADFFDIVILSIFSYVEQQESYNCGIEFNSSKADWFYFAITSTLKIRDFQLE